MSAGNGNGSASADSTSITNFRVVRALQNSLGGILRRRETAWGLGETHAGDRKLYETFGYNRNPTYTDFYQLWDRGGLAGAIVNKPIEKTWSEQPQITDTPDEDEESEFEAAVQFLFDDLGLLSYLERVDKVSAIGRYGVLYLGVQDGVDAENLDEEVADANLDQLAPDTDYDLESNPPPISHFNVVSEGSIDGEPSIESDPTSPRHNFPVSYPIEFEGSQTELSTIQSVHWTRVIHVASGLLESDWDGRSILRRPYNRLWDWEKTVGASAEAAYQSADRKLVFDTDPEVGHITDEDELEDQIDALINDIRPYLQTQGMDVSTISGETQDPSGLTGVIKEEIAGEGGVPQRILTGSERGELASSQDEANFAASVGERQEQFAEPRILRPLIDRLIGFGILPEPQEGEYEVEWPDLFELNELEVAQMRLNNAKAAKNSSPAGDPGVLLTDAQIAEHILHLPDDVVEDIRERTEGDGPAAPRAPPDPGDDLPGDQPPGDGDGDGDGDQPPDEDTEESAAWWSDRYGDDATQAPGADAGSAGLHAAAPDSAAAQKSAAGVTFSGTKGGTLDESRLDADEHDLGDHYLYGSGDSKSDYGYPVVDADGNLRKGNVESAWSLGCRGKCTDEDTHESKLRTLADEFDSPPDFAEDDENGDEEGD